MNQNLFQVLVILLAITVCYGIPLPEAIGRIFGGRPSQPGEFPHQVSLRTLDDRFFCGGAIISQSWTLSAAHCVINRDQDGVIVVAGSVFLDDGGSRHQSSRYINHHLYDPSTLAYDVTVIQNQVPFVFNAYVSPINLGTTTIGGGVNVAVSGWGRDNYWEIPNHLQTVNVTTLTNADCRARHQAEFASRIYDQKICGFTGTGGVCFGDSGSALIYENSVIGIVSWGNGNCTGRYPDVYIRVNYMYDWIMQMIN